MLTILSSSCRKQQIENLETNTTSTAGFDFKTVHEYNVEISTVNGNAPLSGVFIMIFTSNPLSSMGTLKKGYESTLIYKGVSNKNGTLNCIINPPTTVDSIHVLVNHIGFQPLHSFALNGENIIKEINTVTVSQSSQKSSGNLSGINEPTPVVVNGYYTLGTWNNYGVPDYLEPTNDYISNDFLDDVNASLPENIPLPQSHPAYFVESADTNITLVEEGEVWVTLVHEGAGWHNSLGYYTYDADNPPETISDIHDKTVIFPDLSIHSNGLTPGNKIQLYYLDTVTNTYSSLFPAGTTLGWFIVAKGWSSQNQTVTDGVYTHYSSLPLNDRNDPELRKQNVMLWDSERELLLISFEDINRESGGDNDFNDAVFYATSNPVDAYDTDLYPPIDDPLDTDGDGTSNVFDEYPTDPSRAFNNYYPSVGEFGSFIFEDLWPSRGDYDFNDLVVDYHFKHVTNSQNEVVSIHIKTSTKAIGASYHNAFGIQLNTFPSNVTSVTGQEITKDYLDIADNGTENQQDKAVIIIFDDAFNVLSYPGLGVGVNTLPQNPYVSPDTITVDIAFNNPVEYNIMGAPPYNPFIIVDRERGKEVHMPGSEPTSLVNESYFGTGDDDTDVNLGNYYMSDTHLPWALNLPSSFVYPIEKRSIKEAHLHFNTWATSQGTVYKDWYQNSPSYRNYTNIYSKN